MIWLLNSAVLGAGAYGTYEYAPATRAELAQFMRREPLSRIGYVETADLIESWTGIRPALCRDPSALAAGDEAIIVRLRYRVAIPGRKGAPTGATDEDWEIATLRRLR